MSLLDDGLVDGFLKGKIIVFLRECDLVGTRDIVLHVKKKINGLLTYPSILKIERVLNDFMTTLITFFILLTHLRFKCSNSTCMLKRKYDFELS